MKRLLESVQKLETEEYHRAADKFGPINTCSHHSYGVLKEEVDEAMDEARRVESTLSRYWDCVKHDDFQEQERAIAELERVAQLLACEAIQVAAMANKAFLTLRQAKE